MPTGNPFRLSPFLLRKDDRFPPDYGRTRSLADVQGKKELLLRKVQFDLAIPREKCYSHFTLKILRVPAVILLQNFNLNLTQGGNNALCNH